MGARKLKKLLITLLSCICVLSMDAGALLLVKADNITGGTGGSDEGTVLGSSTVVGGKAVILMNPASVVTGSAATQEAAEEEQAGQENSAVYKPQVNQISDGQIVDAAYYKKQSLTQYNFPEDVNAIGDFSFARSGLTEVVIPEGVTRIGYGAFYHCDQLASVEIPDSVTEIEPFAFDMTAWVQQWRADQSELVSSGKEAYLIVGDGILIAYEGNKKRVNIPNGVKKIAGSVFRDRNDITTVTFPTTLTEIGESAFENCSALTSVSGGKNLVSIRDKAFSGCPIAEIQIPETVTEIGRDAFDETNLATGNAVVVFQGTKLPQIGYTNRATRLSNTAYRNRCFEGVSIAVVCKEISNVKGSVLDGSLYGFAGIVCRMDGNKASNQEGILTIIKVNGKVTAYPEKVTISGITYQIQDPSGLVAKSEDVVIHPGLTYAIDSSLFKPQTYVNIDLKSPDTSYQLTMTQSTVAQKSMAVSYQETYGKEAPEKFYGFSMSMKDVRANVPIYKLGEQTITCTLPVPSEWNVGNLHISILGDNGLLREVNFTSSSKQDTNCITFSLDRIADLAIYEQP